MDQIDRYEEMYQTHKDILTPWHELSKAQQIGYLILLNKVEALEGERDEAYRTIGRLVIQNPNVIPVMD